MLRNPRCQIPALVAVLATGCYRAPEPTGTDQVHDPNIAVTKQKDLGLSALEWSVVDDYMEGLIEDDDPGCAVGIARGGSLVYLQGYGKARLDGADWDVGTMGAVGSVSKTFTAAAVLRMEELGMVDLEGRVDDYLSTTNAELGAVRVIDLLAHASGVGGGTQSAAFAPNWTDGSLADDCLWSNSAPCLQLSILLAQPLPAFWSYHEDEPVADLGPGTGGVPFRGVYSNVGYSVLGAIIDDRSPYEAWVWDQVGQYTGDLLSSGNLLSLALTHSWRADDIPNRAVGYTWNDNTDSFDKLDAFELASVGGLEGWEGPSGGWAMTIGDLTRFAVALNEGDIIDDPMLDAMRFVWADLDNSGNHYGLGVFHGGDNQPPYFHGGDIGGHSAVWSYWPAGDGQPSVAIAMICNRDDMGSSSLVTDTANLRRDTRTSSPVQRAMVGLPAVGERVHGRSWSLEHTEAWQVDPGDTFLALTGLSAPIELSARLDGKTLNVAVEQDGQVLASGPVSWRDPWFTTRPATVAVRTVIGSLPVHDFSVRGGVTDKGLSRVSLSGTLDAREVGRVVNRSASDLCTTGSGASRCQPCADGRRYCVSVEYQGLTGTDL